MSAASIHGTMIQLAACAMLAFSPIAPAERLVVVAFGDSTTAPRLVGGRKIKIYTDLLEQASVWGDLQASIVNAGKPSNTTQDALDRMQSDVLRLQPHLVIMQFGINDSAVDVWKNPPADSPRVAIEEYRNNLRRMIKAVQDQGGGVVLMTPNPLRWTENLKQLYGQSPYDVQDPDGLNVLLRDYAQVVRDLAGELNLPLVDIYAAFEHYGQQQGQSTSELLLDGMHPNDKGHRLVCDQLTSALASLDLARLAEDQRPRPLVAGNGVVIHPAATDMPGLLMGPFVSLGDGSILTIQDTNALISHNEGKDWKAYPIFADPASFQISNERALLRTSNGTVILVCMNLREKHWTWSNELHDAPGARLPTYAIRSLDDGRTWQEPVMIQEDWNGAIRSMIETRDGKVVVSSTIMRHNPGHHAALTYTSDDEGKTWQRSNIIDLGGAGHHGGVCEPTIAELTDGKLLMLIRTNWMQQWRAESTDAGLHWHPYGPAGIASSCAPAQLHRLQDGRLLMLWNQPYPEGESSFPLQGGDRIWSATAVSNHRAELSLAVSSDDASTWSKPIVIARKPGAWLAYPYIFEVQPGQLWITTMQGGLTLSVNVQALWP
ncbi:MAG: exo-alpha-sialidase [Phycisphaeraceae bacterium]|nr:exo-alpha-sialidase [Phycisphaeraceae bacterium]